MRHHLVLGDQLSLVAGPLSRAEPAETVVLLVEALDWGRRRPYHRQKLILLYAAMRHFAREAAAAGFVVRERRVATFEAGVAEHLAEYPGAALELMEPADHGVASSLRAAVEKHGGSLQVVPNELWLTSAAEFDAWAGSRATCRMEGWYREMRRRTGWLMEGAEPVGGAWNLDAENRRTPPPGTRFPSVPRFEPDPITREVIAWVEETFPGAIGSAAGFAWPVTRAEALRALDTFVAERLASFGPYEDAMVDGERSLFHSLLSAPLNLGLITARETCEAALGAWAAADGAIPLQSVEGFVRQLLGWREFIRHVYRRRMPELHGANRLGATAPLPDFYWTGETRMRCVGEAVRGVLANGHAHHIERLMVLGNWALLAGVEPRQVNDWFLEAFVDAFDWVVSPNVLGMSQYADPSFTSKPYLAGGAYLSRMSDHCRHCPYDPRRSVGDDACPFSTLYWDFVDRNLPLIAANQRTGPVAAAWRRRDEGDRVAIRARAAEVRRLAVDGTL